MTRRALESAAPPVRKPATGVRMVIEKGVMVTVRMSARALKRVDEAAARSGLTSLDWTRAVLALALSEGRFAPAGDDAEEAKDKLLAFRMTAKMKKHVDLAAQKSGGSAGWMRAVLARAANEGAFAPRKGDKHGKGKKGTA